MGSLFLLHTVTAPLLTTGSLAKRATISVAGIVPDQYALNPTGAPGRNADVALVHREGAYAQDHPFAPGHAAFGALPLKGPGAGDGDSATRKILAMQRFPLLNGDTLLERLQMVDGSHNE